MLRKYRAPGKPKSSRKPERFSRKADLAWRIVLLDRKAECISLARSMRRSCAPNKSGPRFIFGALAAPACPHAQRAGAGRSSGPAHTVVWRRSLVLAIIAGLPHSFAISKCNLRFASLNRLRPSPSLRASRIQGHWWGKGAPQMAHLSELVDSSSRCRFCAVFLYNIR